MVFRLIAEVQPEFYSLAFVFRTIYRKIDALQRQQDLERLNTCLIVPQQFGVFSDYLLVPHKLLLENEVASKDATRCATQLCPLSSQGGKRNLNAIRYPLTGLHEAGARAWAFTEQENRSSR